jgi:hypothetical protein
MRAVRVPRKLGFDTISHVDEQTAKLFVMSGYTFVARYLRRDKRVNQYPDLTGDAVSLTPPELAGLLEAGLLVSAVQFGGGRMGAHLGTDYGHRIGQAAAHNATTLGLPAGVAIWCDAEWSEPVPARRSVREYLDAWSRPVEAAGYEPGLYVGAGTRLSGQELWELPRYRHYWQGNSIVPWVANRGYQMHQGYQCGGRVDGRRAGPRVHGLIIDQDLAHLDQLGERFRVVGP